MVYLVTGATGFIGSHLCEELAKRGKKTRCLVREKETGEMHKENEKMLRSIGAEIYYGDLNDRGSLKNIAKGVDVVFHLAAIARPMNIPREKYFEVNVEGTKNLFEACKGEKIRKIVHVSSISAIGPSRDGKPVSEKTSARPVDTYGESKLESEKAAFDFIKKYKLPVVIVRPPMIYGPGDFELLKLFKAVNTGFFPVNMGGGKGHFEFCFVKNLVKGIILASEKGAVGEIYHLSAERAYTLAEVAGTIAKAEKKSLLKLPFPKAVFWLGGKAMEISGRIFGFHPPFKGGTMEWMTTDYWVSDISKAKKELGYRQEFSLQEGVEETVAWYKKKGII